MFGKRKGSCDEGRLDEREWWARKGVRKRTDKSSGRDTIMNFTYLRRRCLPHRQLPIDCAQMKAALVSSAQRRDRRH